MTEPMAPFLPLASAGSPARRDWRSALAHLAPRQQVATPSEGCALQLMARGQYHEAEACLREALAATPDRAPLLRRLSQVLRITGPGTAWLDARRRAWELDLTAKGVEAPDLPAATTFLLAAEGLAPPPIAAPPGLVARLFTIYRDYDEQLVERLRYRAPGLLVAALIPHLPTRPWQVCDAGCGTGLVGLELADRTSELWGIDLSEAMIERAQARGVYTRLTVGEMVATLSAATGCWDAVVAADVCPYLGDLEPLIFAAQARLAPGGCLGFTAEAAPEDVAWRLGATRRYAHGARYLEERCAAAALRVVSRTEAVLRYEQGEPVHGHVLVARRAA